MGEEYRGKKGGHLSFPNHCRRGGIPELDESEALVTSYAFKKKN